MWYLQPAIPKVESSPCVLGKGAPVLGAVLAWNLQSVTQNWVKQRMFITLALQQQNLLYCLLRKEGPLFFFSVIPPPLKKKPLCLIVFVFKRFIYVEDKLERHIERDFPSTYSPLNFCKGQVWARQSQELHLCLLHECLGPGTWAIFTAFQGALTGSQIQSGAVLIQTRAYMGLPTALVPSRIS